MNKIKNSLNSQAAQTLFLFGLTAFAAYAQSGDISASTAPVVTLGVTILKAVMALVLLACVGVIAWGAVTLGSNRPRGLAMIASGVAGGLIAGLSASVPTGLLLVPFVG